MLPKPSLQFSEEDEAKLLDGRAPVCYFCKGDADDTQSVERGFIRVREDPPFMPRSGTYCMCLF